MRRAAVVEGRGSFAGIGFISAEARGRVYGVCLPVLALQLLEDEATFVQSEVRATSTKRFHWLRACAACS